MDIEVNKTSYLGKELIGKRHFLLLRGEWIYF
jgi:hypothetical protein